MGIDQDLPGRVSQIELVTIGVGTGVLPAAAAVFSTLPAIDRNAIKAARRLRDGAGEILARLSLAANLHETHRHAANINLGSVRYHLVFAELPETFVKEKEACSHAEKKPAGWIRTAHDFRKC